MDTVVITGFNKMKGVFSHCNLWSAEMDVSKAAIGKALQEEINTSPFH